MLNLKSGGIIYDLPSNENEITCMSFLYGTTEYWIAAGCWGGKMILWTEPSESNNFTVSVSIRIGHFSDILDVTASGRFIITAGSDGNCSVWNIFSGTLKCAIQMPDPNLVDH